jgi:hypothetical protein
MDGIDEDHCEELEFNECEDNEYRCEDGSCISEQYWLDGAYDCSDKSDEQNLAEYFLRSSSCPLTSSQFICDETTEHQDKFACGDGQFQIDKVHWLDQCYNYRNIMFFCELPSYDPMKNEIQLWTLENGHCVDKSRIENNLADMDEFEICLFYLKCKLTHGTTTGCDNVLQDFYSMCENKIINYPSEPVLKPYFQTVYELSELEFFLEPTYVYFNGSIKCIGYQARSTSQEIHFDWAIFGLNFRFDHLFCKFYEEKLESGPQIDKNCWNNTKQSFLCQEMFKCISKHRLRNVIEDCDFYEGVFSDEVDSERCYMKNKHRLNCFQQSSLCPVVSKVGDGSSDCNEGNDEFIKQLNWNLADHKCITPNSIECNFLKTYIQSSSLLLPPENSKILFFRQYCDTVWDLPKGFDESLCNEWKCPKDQYQCLSGHCIPIKYLTDNANYDWNCPDASDYTDLLGIRQRSEHNIKIISDSVLRGKKEKMIGPDRHLIPFRSFCNISKEYGCILNNVNDPLNFTINRPCINLTQIGDGIIDCYGGLDERNLLTCGNNIHEQRGFDFHCSDQECIPYRHLCEKRCSNNADNPLCVRLPTLWNSSCSYPKKHTDICLNVATSECYLFNSMGYYCDIQRYRK